MEWSTLEGQANKPAAEAVALEEAKAVPQDKPEAEEHALKEHAASGDLNSSVVVDEPKNEGGPSRSKEHPPPSHDNDKVTTANPSPSDSAEVGIDKEEATNNNSKPESATLTANNATTGLTEASETTTQKDEREQEAKFASPKPDADKTTADESTTQQPATEAENDELVATAAVTDQPTTSAADIGELETGTGPVARHALLQCASPADAGDSAPIVERDEADAGKTGIEAPAPQEEEEGPEAGPSSGEAEIETTIAESAADSAGDTGKVVPAPNQALQEEEEGLLTGERERTDSGEEEIETTIAEQSPANNAGDAWEGFTQLGSTAKKRKLKPPERKTKFDLGVVVYKCFGEDWYFGHVEKVMMEDDEAIYAIRYEDGDREEMDESTVSQFVVTLKRVVARTAIPPTVPDDDGIGAQAAAGIVPMGTVESASQNPLYENLDRNLLATYIQRRHRKQSIYGELAADEDGEAEQGQQTVYLEDDLADDDYEDAGALEDSDDDYNLGDELETFEYAATPRIKKRPQTKIRASWSSSSYKSPRPRPKANGRKFKTSRPFPGFALGTVVYKHFGTNWFFGYIVRIDLDDKLYGVKYEDGEKEELYQDEIDEIVVQFGGKTVTTSTTVEQMSLREWNRMKKQSVALPGTVAVCNKKPYTKIDRALLTRYIRRRREAHLERMEQEHMGYPYLPAASRKRSSSESPTPLEKAKSSTSKKRKKRLRSEFGNFVDETTGRVTESVCDFFRFLHERQSMWVRRNKDELLNWNLKPEVLVLTQDEYFQSYSFCNVYRELDRGTAYFRAHVLNLRESKAAWEEKDWLEHVLWASYAYRQVNRIETFMWAGGIPAIDHLEAFMEKAEQLASDPSKIFFTGAHQTTAFTMYATNLHTILADDSKLLQEKTSELQATKYVRDCLAILETLSGIGSFLGWQIFCDLRESGCLAQCAKDTFCRLGPGALKGLDILGGRQDCTKHTRVLVDIQDKAFSQIDLEFPYWDNRKLTSKEMEHALCEYSKYFQMKTGHCARVRNYATRAPMDLEKPCRKCRQDYDNGTYCDTCLEFYCPKCVVAPPAAGVASWICHRCIQFNKELGVAAEVPRVTAEGELSLAAMAKHYTPPPHNRHRLISKKRVAAKSVGGKPGEVPTLSQSSLLPGEKRPKDAAAVAAGGKLAAAAVVVRRNGEEEKSDGGEAPTLRSTPGRDRDMAESDEGTGDAESSSHPKHSM